MERVLSLLLDGKCHSGEAISRELGVTRAMIWKHIARLKEAGCLIEALPGQGYRLVRPPDFMTQPVLEYCLGDGRPVQAYEELDSTNQAAKDWAAQGAPAGALVTARIQRAGRGRKGRSWQAEPDAGIAMSLLNSKLTQDDPQSAETDRDEEMLEDVTEIVENELHILVERSGFNYSRYATHMQYLFQRIHTGQAIRSDNLQLYTSLREEFPEIAACVEKIAQHIEREWHSALTEEEKLYLILHVNRICIKEGM